MVKENDAITKFEEQRLITELHGFLKMLKSNITEILAKKSKSKGGSEHIISFLQKEIFELMAIIPIEDKIKLIETLDENLEKELTPELRQSLLEKTQKNMQNDKEKLDDKGKFNHLKPTGFDYAPESAKRKREEYGNKNNFEKLRLIHNNVSYNSDGTMNIIKLNKTFCADVSGTGKSCNWEEAKVLAESKGYILGSDYNDWDPDKVKQDSDWYKVINIFSNGNGDTPDGMELFRDMAGCDARYWTDTPYGGGAMCTRTLDIDWYFKFNRNKNETDEGNRVGGFKDME